MDPRLVAVLRQLIPQIVKQQPADRSDVASRRWDTQHDWASLPGVNVTRDRKTGAVYRPDARWMGVLDVPDDVTRRRIMDAYRNRLIGYGQDPALARQSSLDQRVRSYGQTLGDGGE